MSDMISIVYNGAITQIGLGTSVQTLIQQNEFIPVRFLAVLNDEVVPKSLYEKTLLQHNDLFDTILAISGG
ncbi:MAG: sulfur carrier protein ThiS [Piscirickettsiaceae bacterium]|nr:sulfur carrier protein ThiS [Piscirickettsiaceae bacterium]